MPRLTIEEIDETETETNIMSKNPTPTVCLNMIVKNESKIIKDKLEKLCKKVRFDYWVISDTGSTDNTIQIIKDFFQELGIPGELFEDPWQNFGYNRTQAINEAFQKTDYLFIFDADDEIIGDFQFPPDFGKYDSYNVYFGSENFKYLRRSIVNNRKKWRYVGVLHEVISEVDKGQTSSTIEGNYYFESGRSSSRNENPNKYYDDAQILEKAFQTELDDPNGEIGLAHRYAFYCAQSYKDAGQKYVDKAIEWYKKVLTLNNWAQEKYISCLTLGDLYKSKSDYENALYYWLKTIEYDQERIEGVVSATEEYRNQGCNLLVNTIYHKYRNYKKDFSDKLFLHKDKYNDNLEYQNCICAYYVNDHESGYESCKRIIINRLLNLNIVRSAFANMGFYLEQLKKDLDTLQLFYKVQDLLADIKKSNLSNDDGFFKIWQILFEKNMHHFIQYPEPTIINSIPPNSEKPTIFLSFTTCKRVDLFRKTVNSILNQWTDYNKVDYWFCVDDNSSSEDRLEMVKSYSWIDYYFKTPEKKGHRESMNIIWKKLDELKPKYWIHMEDDFLFHDKMPYVENAIKGLKILEPYNVKQLLFNVNYCETIDSYNVKGDEQISGDPKYSVHVHKEGTYHYVNNHYWPHYSFRPSLIDVSTILSLGDFDSENQFFEMDYADKWAKAGFKSGFFNRITCRHIGRLTSERGDNSQINAYYLNDESQFYSGEINVRKEAGLPFKVAEMKNYMPVPSLKTNIKVVNLLKREDRKATMTEILSNQDFEEDDYEFVEAVDGSTLEPSEDLKKLFKGNDFGSRCGFIGCALTHLMLWKHLINDEDNDYYVILEDDAELCTDFKEKLRFMENKCINSDVIFFGYHMFDKERKNLVNLYNYEEVSDQTSLHPLDRNLYIGGTFCYSVNKAGAKAMIDYIEKNNIKHGIDYVMKINNSLMAFESRPHLAFSDWNENGKKIDSDIQNSFDALDLSSQKYCGNLKIFYHISCINNWKEIVESQLTRIKTSGLYDKVKNIYCFLVDPTSNVEYETNVEYIEKYGEKIKVLLVEKSGNEIITLSNIKKYIEYNDRFLYIHSKGVTRCNEPYYKNVEDWRKLMEFFLIDNYQKCIEELNNYDAIGINYVNTPKHFSGNFWWTNFCYYKKLNDIIENEETHIFSGNPKYISLFQSGLEGYGHYNNQYPETMYNNISFSNKKLNLENDFVFVKGKDQINNDIYGRKSRDECIEFCINDSSCIAFNTLGFLKNKITKLTTSPYFGVNDGIYIKKDAYEEFIKNSQKLLASNNDISRKQPKREGKIRVKMMCDWCSSEQLCENYKKMCKDPENYCWDNLQITWEEEDIDYYVLINRPLYGVGEYYDPEKTIVFQMEPWVYNDAKPWGVKTWGEWASPDPAKFLHVNAHKKYLNNVEWHLDQPLVEIQKPIKTTKMDKISAICSSKNYDEGQMLRNQFIGYISEQEKEEQTRCIIDVYGKFNYHHFACYKGPLEHDNKYNGMHQYKYHLACENNAEPGYATEKIWDAILCETLCFYWGCPNLEQSIDAEAFVRLDLNDKEGSLKIIQQAISEDWWSQRIHIVRKMKTKILEELAFFPNLQKILDSKREVIQI